MNVQGKMVLVVLFLSFFIISRGVVSGSPGSTKILIKGVTITDLSDLGRNSEDIHDGFVLICDGLIEMVGNIESVPELSTDIRIINAKGDSRIFSNNATTNEVKESDEKGVSR